MKRYTKNLDKSLRKRIDQNASLIKGLLHSSLQGLGFVGEIMPLEQSIEKYNKGISKDEIKAWVWYRRSLGIPMYGWETYFLSSEGETIHSNILIAEVETTIKDNHFRNTKTVKANTKLGKRLNKSHSYNGTEYIFFKDLEGIKMVNSKHVRVDNTKTIKANKKELESLIDNKALFYVDGELLPYAAFTFGNMYDRLLEVQKSKAYITQKYGQVIYDYHIETINKVRPKPLSITNPIASERPRILAISKFTRNFTVSNLTDSSGVILQESVTLQEAFKDWLRALPEEAFEKSKHYEIINYYLNGDIKPREMDKIEWASIQKNSRDEAERLFIRFLHEAVTLQDQQKIDINWNRTYNGHSALQYHKIPVGFEVSNSFHGFEFDIRPAQREGVAFMELVGSGIIAYDVGVGKTITAIIELANAIKTGKCSRPLVVVPNPTYKNWIKEMIGFGDKAGVLSGTGITINEWYNLGTSYARKIKLNKQVPERTITLVTYEGLMKIGFGERLESDLFMELSNIMEQDKETSERDKEIRAQKYRELLGVGQKDTIADLDQLGFDYMVIDEAHNFKNVFSEVKSETEEDGGDGKKRFHIRGGKPSVRAIKAFFLCNAIQRTFGRNVMLLTATPFTNSPLEIYSMLSLVGYHYLKQMGMYNIAQFFEQYILETTENVVGIDGEIKESNVVKTFNNRISLQKLIHNHINFKTGEEAGIPRPCKINLPKTKIKTNTGTTKRLTQDEQILTYLRLTPWQEKNQKQIARSASLGASREDPSRLLRIMNQSLNNALSPFLFSNESPENYLNFVEESPKIHYTLECIRSVKEWHEQRSESVSGQVIYINRGKEYFPLIKAYLEQEVGYQRNKPLLSNSRQKVDEVEIITGGISQSKKEKIKTAFNEGVCKVLIGTSTIREGINLQKKGTVLYNLYPDWNPTSIRQLEGRIWRQKNEFGYVRIAMPLMENSMDIFVFQKLEEKTSRINDIWAKSDRGNVLDEESLDPNEIKYALITDIGVLTRFEIKQQASQLSKKANILKANIKDLEEFQDNFERYQNHRTILLSNLTEKINRLFNKSLFVYTKPNGNKVEVSLATKLSKEELSLFTKADKQKLDRAYILYDDAKRFSINSVQDDKELIKLTSRLNRMLEQDWDKNLYNFKEYLSKYKKTERSLLTPRGYKITDDFQKIIADFNKEQEQVADQHQELHSKAYQDKIRLEILEKKKVLEIKGGSIDDRVKEFASLNYLMSYKFSDIDHTSCKIPTKELKPTIDMEYLRLKSKSRKRRIRILAMAS
jgi:hypothetical protein